MWIAHLDLRGFRSYQQLSLDLPGGMVVVHGPNGSGKTNLVEGICVAASGDSPRARTSDELVRAGAEHAFVRGEFVVGGRRMRLEVGLARTGRRQVKIGGAVRRREDLIGLAPVVMFWAEDIEMVRGEASGRRRMMDRELSLLSRPYAHHLVRYRRALEQRNRLLKLIREGRERSDALDPWDRALARHGARVIVGRRQFVGALAPEAREAHGVLTGTGEALVIQYRPSAGIAEGRELPMEEREESSVIEEIAGELLKALAEQRRGDIGAGATSCGPHRDDLELLVAGRPVRVFGSQGEQRSCAVAIRMGLAAVARAMTGEGPLVLLDDVLSELDERHRRGVFAACAGLEQVVMTCCDYEDIPAEVRGSGSLFELMEGAVSAR
jgi:DNA replication and repair protein RecF